MSKEIPIRLEILAVEINEETRYGVMAVIKEKVGVSFEVYYGDRCESGSIHDWGTSPDEVSEMTIAAGALLVQIANKY